MILREATIRFAGYDPEDLSHGSRKRICYSCDECGRIRWGRKISIRSLCKSCSHSGKNNPMYGITGELSPNYHKEFSEEHKRKIGLKHKNKNISIETRKKQHYNRLGMHNTLESRIKTSCTNQGINREDFNGFIKQNKRNYVLPEYQCLKINKYFKGSHRHHISADVIVYIPEKLHRHISHNIQTGQGMKEMNLLSLQYLRGWL